MMGHRYLALIGANGRGTEQAALAADEFLREAGLHLHPASGPIKLFVSDEAPVLCLPGGNIIIGRIFCRDGSPVRSGENFPELPSNAQTRKHVLDDFWGDYVLIQSSAEIPDAFNVMCSPSSSCDVPCVYSLENDAAFITSDISLAVQSGLYRKRIDWDFIAQRLAYPDIKTGRTGLIGVRELLPGCTLEFRGSDATIITDWSPWGYVSAASRHSDPHEAAAHIRTAIETVVQAWAKADMSILVELSGGLDSSIIGACLRDTPAKVTCCTLTTPVPGADERHYAKLIAKYLNAKLQVETLGVESARFDATPPAHLVTPRMGPLQHEIDVTMGAAGDRSNITSFFSGGGGDTVFCYLTNATPAADAFREAGLTAGLRAIRNLSELHQCTLWKAGRLTLRKLLLAPKAALNADHSFLSPALDIGKPEDHPWFVAPPGALSGDRQRVFDLASTQIYRDIAPRGMRRQLRLPLLSQPVMEACLRVPSWMWISGGQNRSVARSAFADVLPPEILTRRSKGNFMSYLGAIYQRKRHDMYDFLATGQLQARGLLDMESLHRFIHRELPARDRSFTRIFDLCTVENWVRHQA